MTSLATSKPPLSLSPKSQMPAPLRSETPAGPGSVASPVVLARVGEKLGLMAALRVAPQTFSPKTSFPLRSLRGGALRCPSRRRGFHSPLRRLAALVLMCLGVIFVSGMVGFCGSRALPTSGSVSSLVVGVVGSVLGAPGGRGVAVGCAIGGDALVVSSALAASGAARLSVFAAFGPVSPPWPAACVSAPGASSSASSVSGVTVALAAGASVSWWAGGGPGVPLAGRLAGRSVALVLVVAGSGAGRGFVGFVTSPCPSGLVSSASPSACFSGHGSGSWGSLALASGCGLPVVVFPVGALASPCALPASWGSWSPLSGAWSGGFRLLPASPALFDR